MKKPMTTYITKGLTEDELIERIGVENSGFVDRVKAMMTDILSMTEDGRISLKHEPGRTAVTFTVDGKSYGIGIRNGGVWFYEWIVKKES